MTDYTFGRKEMADPIQRMFEREVPSEYGMFEMMEDEETEGGSGNVDIVYVAGANENLHVIRLEQSYDNCLFDVSRGIHSMSDVDANYVWIALPLDEFREGEDQYNDIMMDTCQSRGQGIITLQPKGRGISAKILIEAEKKDGEHLGKYGDLEERWRTRATNALAEEDLKVVNYYNK